MVRKTPRVREGFTLIELSLSIIFVGILSLAIVLIISNTIASYRRGLTLNQINTVGMDLVDDFRSAVQNSTLKLVSSECEKRYGSDSGSSSGRGNCDSSNGAKFVNYSKTANINIKGTNETIPIYGAFCTGSYSYIWNSGYFLSPTDALSAQWATLKYKTKESKDVVYSSNEEKEGFFRLLKVRDESRTVCASTLDNSYNSTSFNGTFDITGNGALDEDPVELLLSDADNRLALYGLETTAPAESTTNGSVFYSVSFILGTIDSGININATGNSCTVPTDGSANFDYCAINKFNFAIQAGGA